MLLGEEPTSAQPNVYDYTIAWSNKKAEPPELFGSPAVVAGEINQR
jgi:hypothetical protein